MGGGIKKALAEVYKALQTGTEHKDIGFDYAYRVGSAQATIEHVKNFEKIDLDIMIEGETKHT